MFNLFEYLHYLWDKLVGNPNVANGFIEREPEKDDYLEELGVVSKKAVKEDCQWDKFRSDPELQKRNKRETMACVTFSAMNCIETLINYYIHLVNNDDADNEIKKIVELFYQFGLINNNKADFSDRYIAKASGTTMRGNTQKRVADTIRHYGLIPEKDWPWDSNSYYKTIPNRLIEKGKLFAKYIEFNYEWVNPSQFNAIKKFGTIQTSLFGWGWTKNGIYQRVGNRRNHAVDNDGFVLGQYDKIFDTYEPTSKKVSWDFNLGIGMLYSVHLREVKYNQAEIDKQRKRGFQYILKAEGGGEIFELTDNGLVYISPKEWNTLNVKRSASEKKLIGISNEYFLKLVV